MGLGPVGTDGLERLARLAGLVADEEDGRRLTRLIAFVTGSGATRTGPPEPDPEPHPLSFPWPAPASTPPALLPAREETGFVRAPPVRSAQRSIG